MVEKMANDWKEINKEDQARWNAIQEQIRNEALDGNLEAACKKMTAFVFKDLSGLITSCMNKIARGEFSEWRFQENEENYKDMTSDAMLLVVERFVGQLRELIHPSGDGRRKSFEVKKNMVAYIKETVKKVFYNEVEKHMSHQDFIRDVSRYGQDILARETEQEREDYAL